MDSRPAGRWGGPTPGTSHRTAPPAGPTAAPPFLVRAIEQQHRVAERARREEHGGRLLADVAVRDDRVPRPDAGVREELRELVVALQPELVVGDLGEGDVVRAGDVA